MSILRNSGDTRDGLCDDCAHAPGQHPVSSEDVAELLRRLQPYDVLSTRDNIEIAIGYHEAVEIEIEYVDPTKPMGNWFAMALAWDASGGISAEQEIAEDTSPERCLIAVLSFLEWYKRQEDKIQAQLDQRPEED